LAGSQTDRQEKVCGVALLADMRLFSGQADESGYEWIAAALARLGYWPQRLGRIDQADGQRRSLIGTRSPFPGSSGSIHQAIQAHAGTGKILS
jgi:hypothetical protein